MKVTLETQRGFGAGVVPPLTVDSSSLSAQAAGELARLVAAAKADKSNPRDGQEKIVVVDTDGTVALDRQVALTEMSPALAALRNWVREHAGRGQG